MGRSRGGLTTKIHVLVDAAGPPIDIVLSTEQAHDGPIARQLLHHLSGEGILMGDKAYDADAAATCLSSAPSSVASATWPSASSTR